MGVEIALNPTVSSSSKLPPSTDLPKPPNPSNFVVALLDYLPVVTVTDQPLPKLSEPPAVELLDPPSTNPAEWLTNIVTSTIKAAPSLPEFPKISDSPPPAPLTDPNILLRGSESSPPAVPFQMEEEEENWLRRVQARWSRDLEAPEFRSSPGISDHHSALPTSSRLLFFVQPPPVDRMENSLERLHWKFRNSSSRPDELREDFRLPDLLPRSPLHLILAELDFVPVLNTHKKHRKKPPKKTPREKNILSQTTNLVLPPTQAIADSPPLPPAPIPPIQPPFSPIPERELSPHYSLVPKIVEASEEPEGDDPVRVEIPRPPEILGRATKKGLSCQVCRMGVRSREFPDFYSEEEGRKWRLCASCVSGVFPSLSVGRVPRGEHLMIGKSNSEFLWELNPRACVAVKMDGSREGEETMVWPTAYAAIAAEMFESENSVREELYGCFDAEEVDEVVRRRKAKIRSDWRFVRVGIIRKILKIRTQCHPLLERLLFTISDKIVSFGDLSMAEEVVLGDAKTLANITMELIDEAASKNRS